MPLSIFRFLISLSLWHAFLFLLFFFHLSSFSDIYPSFFPFSPLLSVLFVLLLVVSFLPLLFTSFLTGVCANALNYSQNLRKEYLWRYKRFFHPRLATTIRESNHLAQILDEFLLRGKTAVFPLQCRLFMAENLARQLLQKPIHYFFSGSFVTRRRIDLAKKPFGLICQQNLRTWL